MRMIIDIPEKYIEASKGLLALLADDVEDMDDLNDRFERLKGNEIKLELSDVDPKKEKELYLGLIMLAVSSKEIMGKGED